MREFRRVIYRNQYRAREDCSPRVSQILLFRFGAAGARAASRTPCGRDPGFSARAGGGRRVRLGAPPHGLALGIVLKTRRVLLVAPHQDWLYADHDLCAEECRCLGCRMLPLSTCSLSDLGDLQSGAAPISLGKHEARRAPAHPPPASGRAGGGAQANKTVLYYDFAAWSDAALARSVAAPGEARPRASRSGAPSGPAPRRALKAGRATRAGAPHSHARQAVAFLLRSNARGAAWLEEGLRAAGLAPGAPCVSIHVRRQDKRSEARPLPLARYVERAEPFLRALNTTLFFVATDEAAVLREEAGAYGPRYTFLHAPTRTARWVFDHASHLRERRRGGTRTREWKAAMVDVVALATCGASVVTFSSNIGRLVAELATFLRHNHTRVRGEVVSLDDTFFLPP
eukprot:tig00021587_g22702.t1